MTLRTRILSGFAFLLAVFAVLATIVVFAQRGQLEQQVDAQLRAAAPLGRGPAGGARPNAPARPGADNVSLPEQPVSDFWVGVMNEEGVVESISEGQLLTSVPDLSAVDATTRVVVTTDAPSVEGPTTFRLRVEPREPGMTVLIIATPRTDIDQTISRLVLSFVLGGLILMATLALLAMWVIRLGLRPVSAVTTTARAIRSGDRIQRAPQLDTRTEAGELASAFNLMLDERDEAEDRLRRFVSDASHELRTPLTSIRGYLDLWSQGGFREQDATEDAVRRMQSESERMASLVEDLLHLARLDEGQPIETTEVSVRQLLEDVAADARAALPGAHVEPPVVVPADLRAHLDPQRVQQVLAGLVSNAITHNDDPTVTLAANVEGATLVLSVGDDGSGMGAEDAERAFDRFHRADDSRNRATGGSGLGLAIAKAVVERHDGTIQLVTSPGAGCTFTIRLPLTGPAGG